MTNGTGSAEGGSVYNRTMRWLKHAAAVGSVAVLVMSILVLSDHARIAAPLLLLDVVAVARFAGLGPALLAASTAAVAYSYYFLAPRGLGFGIYSPEDWFAFVTFVVTAFLAGELASRAQRRAMEAQAGKQEIERLYEELRSAFDRASEAEAARRNEQLKAALLDALTHNLRTPLTAIKAAVTALMGSWDRSAELSNEARGELLVVIDEESDRLNRFVEGLSNLDPTQASQPIHLRPTRLEDLIRGALLRAENVTRNHDIVVELDDQLPQVAVEPASIVEVVYMVLDNAGKYSPMGTRIAVRAARSDERHVQVTISDQGPGIPAELRERVFEKFFRVPARESHDQRSSGIGLGLPIARRLVEAQAGRIWIDAPQGHGTTVAMTLPVALEGVGANLERAATVTAR